MAQCAWWPESQYCCQHCLRGVAGRAAELGESCAGVLAVQIGWMGHRRHHMRGPCEGFSVAYSSGQTCSWPMGTSGIMQASLYGMCASPAADWGIMHGQVHGQKEACSKATVRSQAALPP
jgi:hypothetical protein